MCAPSLEKIKRADTQVRPYVLLMIHRIHIGPAGWSYKDWEGIVYPKKPGAKFDPLKYLARFFNTIEINSSFYRPFTAATVKSWISRVAGAADFMFTAKPV